MGAGGFAPPLSVISLKKVLVFISYLLGFVFIYKTRVASENIIINIIARWAWLHSHSASIQFNQAFGNGRR